MTKFNTLKKNTLAGKQCAPSRKGCSCFTLKELRRIAQQYNTSVQSLHRRGGSFQPIQYNTKDKKQLWTDIDVKMQASTTCTTEICWASQHQQTMDLVSTAFRPSMPASWSTNTTEWLSTSDIQSVMKQYEHSHKGFYFVGAVPVDFENQSDNGEIGKCVIQALCNVRIKQWWKQGIRQVGIIYNLDPHDEPGSHWVSSVIDLENNHVYYYDSFGIEQPYEINTFMENISTQLEDFHNTPCTIHTNDNRHQFRNTECGVYSMYFIASMIDGVSYDEFINNGLNDVQMNKYRHVFYNTLHKYDNRIEQRDGLVGGGRRRRKKTQKKKSK